MADSVIAALLDQLAAELSRSVVINDPAMQLLYASAHFGDEDPVRVRAVLHHGADPQVRGHVLSQGVSDWGRPGTIPADPELGMHARVCWPVRFEGTLLGLLIVLDADGSLTAAEIDRVDEVTGLLATALHSRQGAGGRAPEASSPEDEAAVLDLVDRDPSLRRRAIGTLGRAGRSASFASIQVVRITVVPRVPTTRHHLEIALRTALAARPGPDGVTVLSAVDGGEATVLYGRRAANPIAVEDLVLPVLQRASELGNGHFGPLAGIGGPGVGLDHAVRSHPQAELALRAAGLGIGGPVVSWEQLGAHGPLLAIPTDALTETLLPAELRRLQEVDRDGLLTHTVRAYLDAAGNGPAAAQELHIHRTTLYYRLGRVAELTGLDIADGATRAALQIGFALDEVLARTTR